MSDIRFNQWLHQSGTGGVSQVASGAVGVGTTNPLADFYVRGDAQITGILTAGHIAMGSSITFGDDDRAYFGDGTDLQIYHSGSDSFISDTGTGDLLVTTSQMRIKNAANNATMAVFTQGGKAQLWHNNSQKFETTGLGVTVFGTTQTQQLNVSGISTFNDDVNVVQGKKINFGATNGTQGHIYFDGSTTRFQTNSGLNIGSPVVALRSSTLAATMGEFVATGAVKLFYDYANNNDPKFETTNTGAVITGIVTATSRVSLGNNTTNAVDLEFGTNRGSAGDTLANINWKWNNTYVAQIRGIAGSDTTNKDDAHLNFYTASAGSLVERLKIHSTGEVTIGNTIPTTFRYTGTGHPYNNNNYTIHSFSNIGLVGQYSTLNMPMDHSAATTAGNWWMLGRSSGNTNEWGLSTRPGNSNNLRRVWRCVTRSQNDGILDYQTFHSFTGTETLRIDSSSRALINNRGNAMPGLSANADDLVIGYGTESNETGISMYSTTASGIRFNDNSGTDGAIEYAHSARELRFNAANANRLIFGVNASNSPVFSFGTGHYSSGADGNNHNQGDRASVKVGAYLHLESALGAGHNSRAGLGYNCYFHSLESFYCGTRSPSGGDNRPAAYGMAYGNHYFYSDASNTAHSAQASLTMTKNMIIHRQGYVTKPNNPSFHVGNPNLAGYTSGNVWRCHANAIYSNNGNHYDNSTGRFTAPVAGTYFFFHWGMSQSANQTCDIYSRKNGSRDQIGTSFNHPSGAQHDQFGCSYVRTLSAGDYVDVYTANGNVYNNSDGRHGGWGGWLIG